jgi:2-polyprenyl-6-hydroxyphenyl methylase/3-demethylubiquinone-9 3-methyltransferase
MCACCPIFPSLPRTQIIPPTDTPPMTPDPTPKTTIDPADVARFSALAAEWWNPTGTFRPLHRFNPVRIQYIRDRVTAHFARPAASDTPLQGLTLLDIGCGGGLLSEPMTRLGARVTGVDASEKNIKTAATHAAEVGLEIDYRATTAEALAATGAQFDVILNMEVIEHVADVPLFLASCCRMLKPGGLMVIATLNRTPKAFALAIVGAEYVLRWLPRGTHDWRKFLRPSEIVALLHTNGLTLGQIDGVSYHPLQDRWALSRDTAVNYLLTATRPH